MSKSLHIAGGALLLFGAGCLLYSKLKKSRTGQETEQPQDQTKNFTDMSLPRGYRNNNPLNIRITNTNWQGQVTPNTDGSFEQFTSMAYGYRAAFKILTTYINKYGCNTITQIINRWAPASDGNNPTNYINRVCNMTGYTPETVIVSTNYTQMSKLVYAMSIVENGSVPQPDEHAITLGWNLYIKG